LLADHGKQLAHPNTHLSSLGFFSHAKWQRTIFFSYHLQGPRVLRQERNSSMPV